ncbi:cell envelope biogenesis protein OmpA [Erwiniaceae bacterium BAC15a-03b]|uniref:Cell envelope biogenesis protein OmpA n=1 Tax=Winslowiella arboricola TaxID=2978220 RepID=A0A9J6PFS5_9GAMM|nr:cell envelope biogenesis protein OmpA [Winslowiella arboricola]MCU5772841.1 cell envelope biogenesis protein OmpA [Winslowiella arboricola]MCU5777145.1 cell envelope biogenesis protein OmpA [Winslowiella arboricola]
MKNAIFAFTCLLSTSVFAQSYTGYPDIPGTAQGYATKVVSYTPGSGVASGYNVPAHALGAPNYFSESEQAFALGPGGNVVLSFEPLAIKKNGTNAADFFIYEEAVYDSFDAYVSNDGVNWLKAPVAFQDINPTPSGSATTRGSVIGFDVDSLASITGSFALVKIVDTSRTTGGNAPGADIDAVVVTSAENLGSDVLVDTDSRNGVVYDLYQNSVTGAIGVKIIDKNNVVKFVTFSTDASLQAIALSLQGDFNCDDQKDINVLAARKSDNVQLNIIKQQDGTALKTIDNSVTK